MYKKHKRATALCGAGIFVAWLLLGLFNLYTDHVTKFSYGVVWFMLLCHIALHYWDVYEYWTLREREEEFIKSLREALKQEDA